jgi:hypothetical protein
VSLSLEVEAELIRALPAAAHRWRRRCTRLCRGTGGLLSDDPHEGETIPRKILRDPHRRDPAAAATQFGAILGAIEGQTTPARRHCRSPAEVILTRLLSVISMGGAPRIRNCLSLVEAERTGRTRNTAWSMATL